MRKKQINIKSLDFYYIYFCRAIIIVAIEAISDNK